MGFAYSKKLLFVFYFVLNVSCTYSWMGIRGKEGDITRFPSRLLTNETAMYEATKAFIKSCYDDARASSRIQGKPLICEDFCYEIIPQIRMLWEARQKRALLSFLISIARAHRTALELCSNNNNDQTENVFFGEHIFDQEKRELCDQDMSLQKIFLITPVLEKMFEDYKDEYIEQCIFNYQIANISYYTKFWIGSSIGILRNNMRKKIEIITGALLFIAFYAGFLATEQTYIIESQTIRDLSGCTSVALLFAAVTSCAAYFLLPSYLYPSRLQQYKKMKETKDLK